MCNTSPQTLTALCLYCEPWWMKRLYVELLVDFWRCNFLHNCSSLQTDFAMFCVVISRQWRKICRTGIVSLSAFHNKFSSDFWTCSLKIGFNASVGKNSIYRMKKQREIVFNNSKNEKKPLSLIFLELRWIRFFLSLKMWFQSQSKSLKIYILHGHMWLILEVIY